MSKIDKTTGQPVAEPTLDEANGRREGPAVAAILATGVGTVVLGLMTTLAEVSEKLSSWLDLYSRVGPLSGKTIVAVVGWLLSWAILHRMMRERGTLTRAVLLTTGVLIGLGLLGTFPTFFELFAAD